MDGNNIQPVDNIQPDELPEGFTLADPQGGRGSSGGAAQKQQKDEQKQAILEQALTADALARLRRIKLVKNVDKLENGIVSMAMSGKLTGRINEGKLIEMLERSVPQKPTDIKIQRKKYAFDSDDEDDDDD